MSGSRRGRGPYPPEFRREAVELYRSSGKSLKLIAEELGVAVEALRSWNKPFAIDAGEREGLSSDEREDGGMAVNIGARIGALAGAD